MNKERASLLTAALRSGKYTQTRGVLCRTAPSMAGPIGHCCLGVACEVAIENGVNVHKAPCTAYSPGTECMEYDHARIDLPVSVRDWYGFQSRDGLYQLALYGGSQARRSLSADNDHGRTFHEIADFIDANFERL